MTSRVRASSTRTCCHRNAHICAGTGIALPHLHRDRAHPRAHIFAGARGCAIDSCAFGTLQSKTTWQGVCVSLRVHVSVRVHACVRACVCCVCGPRLRPPFNKPCCRTAQSSSTGSRRRSPPSRPTTGSSSSACVALVLARSLAAAAASAEPPGCVCVCVGGGGGGLFFWRAKNRKR